MADDGTGGTTPNAESVALQIFPLLLFVPGSLIREKRDLTALRTNLDVQQEILHVCSRAGHEWMECVKRGCAGDVQDW
jgi:hypothetical protein